MNRKVLSTTYAQAHSAKSMANLLDLRDGVKDYMNHNEEIVHRNLKDVPSEGYLRSMDGNNHHQVQ